jgi:phosphate transport system protein
MREAFDSQLQEMLQRLLLMGGLTESMIEQAIHALLQADESLTQQVMQTEQRVDALQVELDEACVRLTVQHQPVARDVRFIFVVSRVASNVERIADQAINITQNTRFALAGPQLQPPAELRDMASAVRKMVGSALAAIVMRDVRLAQEVIEIEKEVNRLRDHVFMKLLTDMNNHPQRLSRELSLILISRNLEKIGDHATNIAKEAIYLVRGQDVRHDPPAD